MPPIYPKQVWLGRWWVSAGRGKRSTRCGTDHGSAKHKELKPDVAPSLTGRLLATTPTLALAGLFALSPVAPGHLAAGSASPATAGAVSSQTAATSVRNTAVTTPLAPEAAQHLTVGTPPGGEGHPHTPGGDATRSSSGGAHHAPSQGNTSGEGHPNRPPSPVATKTPYLPDRRPNTPTHVHGVPDPKTGPGITSKAKH